MGQAIAKVARALMVMIPLTLWIGAVGGHAQATAAPPDRAWLLTATDKCSSLPICGGTRLGDHDVVSFYVDGTYSAVRGDRPTPGDPTPQLNKVTGTWHIGPGSAGDDFIIDEATFTFLGGGGGPPTTEGPFLLEFDLGVPAIPGHYMILDLPPLWPFVPLPQPGVISEVEVIKY